MGAKPTKPISITASSEKSLDSEWKTSSSRIYLNKKIKAPTGMTDCQPTNKKNNNHHTEYRNKIKLPHNPSNQSPSILKFSTSSKAPYLNEEPIMRRKALKVQI